MKNKYPAILTRFEMNILANHLYTLMQENTQDITHKIKNLLKLRDVTSWTVAHHLANAGVVFQDRDILLLADKFNNTVAHIMARKGYVFDVKEFPDIVSKENIYGESVLDVMKAMSGDRVQEGINVIGFNFEV